MSQFKLAPKYILLTAPTLKHSRSTHVNSLNARSFEVDQKTELDRLPQTEQEKRVFKKPVIATKQLDSVRQELASCMQEIINQSKRNNVLKQLNSILSRSNNELDEKSKNEWKERVEKDKKKLEKEEYEIEQILQKFNQEVARINTLRQMANSARTDRVVYSALFKKIQWEIKHYQNLYREIIIKTQANKIAKSKKLTQVPENLQSVDQIQYKEQGNKTWFKFDEPMKHPLFVTEVLKNGETKGFRKGVTQRTHQTQNKLGEIIQEFQSKMQQIVKTVQCNSVEDAIEWYNSLQTENAKLLNLIDEEQFKIQDYQSQIMRINQEKRNSEVIQERNVKRLQSLSSNRKMRTAHQVTAPSECSEETTPEFVLKLAKIAGIHVTKDRLLTDIVVELDQRLSRQQLVNSELRSGSNLQTEVQGILNKMERFDSCQRIFSKRQFQGQYMRQLSKQKKHQRGRK